MFNFLLSAADGTALSLGDKLSIGGQVTLLGMGTVFAILALLWGLVELLHVILKPFAEKKTGTFNPPPVVAPAPAVSPAAKNTEKRSDDLELTAVITAAVEAYRGADAPAFCVVSFKRANNRFSSGK